MSSAKLLPALPAERPADKDLERAEDLAQEQFDQDMERAYANIPCMAAGGCLFLSGTAAVFLAVLGYVHAIEMYVPKEWQFMASMAAPLLVLGIGGCLHMCCIACAMHARRCEKRME